MWDGFAESPFFDMERQACEENGVRVEVCEQLLIDGMLDHEHVRIFKPDAWFSTKHMAKPPKSVDCMVIVKNNSNEAIIWFIENKDIKSLDSIKFDDVIEKFRETSRWAESVLNEFLTEIHLKEVRAYFVTTLYKHLPEEKWNKRIKDSSLIRFSRHSNKIPFANGYFMIQPLPSPQEICY
ncbi:MAG: hypothetical protein HQL55_15585 [Magnetococcales bacterium]|nr:hypothetical protein [Magnetococcales bacterium]